MPSVGFEGAFGQQAMAEQIRQRLIDELNKTKTLHGMSVEDQRLALEKQRMEQEVADRALLRSQQADVFKEKQAEGLAANLGGGQTVISPELATRFQNTTLAPLVQPDQTLPSTQVVSGGTPDTTAATEKPSVLTGQMRFMGTPAANAAQQQMVLRGRLLSDPSLTPQQRVEMQAETAGLKAPTREPKPTSEPLESIVGPSGKPVLTPRSQAAGKTPYVKPGAESTVTIQTVDDTGKKVTRVLPKSEAIGKSFAAGPSATTETRLASAQAVTQTGNDIIAKVSDPSYAATLGPALGRYSKLSDFIGNPPPEFAELAGLIESYALANMGVHGMRSAQGAEQIKKLLDGHHTPASLAASIRGLNGFSQHFMENEGRRGATTPASAPPPLTAEELIKKYGR